MQNPIQMIFAAYLSFQWLQVTMKLLIANFLSINLETPQLVEFGNNVKLQVSETTPLAMLLGLSCVLAISFGFRVLGPRIKNFHLQIGGLSSQRLAIIYFCLWLVSLLAGPYAGGGFAQFLIVLGWMRFVPLTLLAFQWLSRSSGSLWLFAVIATEVVTGFLGYFSGFRNVFFILGVAVLTLRNALERRAIKSLFVGFIAVLILGSFWTAIKPAYRIALNLGSTKQAVEIGVSNQIELLITMAGHFGFDSFKEGFFGLLVRISYIDYLEDVLRRVPASVPFQDGALWGEAFSNLKPRILFPDKGVLASDSERTMAFTGHNLASTQEGTSISVGYVADGYIDFGMSGTLIVSILLGLLYGLMARHIVSLNRTHEFSATIAVLVVLYFPVQQFEVSNVKLLGGIIWQWIGCVIFIRYVWPSLSRFCSR